MVHIILENTQVLYFSKVNMIKYMKIHLEHEAHLMRKFPLEIMSHINFNLELATIDRKDNATKSSHYRKESRPWGEIVLDRSLEEYINPSHNPWSIYVILGERVGNINPKSI